MQKEKLTIQNIKKDLHKEVKDSYIRLVIFSVSFLVIIGIILAIPNSHFLFFLYKLLFGLYAFIFLLLLITQIKDLIMFHKNIKNKTCIVKDKLISAEIRGELWGKTYVDLYCLNFSQYGEHVIREQNYNWSSMFSMNAEGVYNYSNSGDEFYLVLSKPHTGRILFAYNTKLFELEE